jgi:hypothetical protein
MSEAKKRKFLNRINKEIDNYKLLGKKSCEPKKNLYYANLEGLVRARTMYLRIYEEGFKFYEGGM